MSTDILAIINETFHKIVWGAPTVALFLFCGFVFSVRIKFAHIFRFREMLRLTFGTQRDAKKGVSGFGSLCASLAGTLGTGNIIGVATAIAAGGPGAVFWMWVSALLGMATHYAEAFLAVKYRKESGTTLFGGPMYYIRDGAKKPFLAGLFAALCLAASFGTGNLVQSNSAAMALSDSFGISPVITCCICAVVVGAVLLGGVKRLASISTAVIPIASLAYMGFCTAAVLMNIRALPTAVAEIFTDAFSFRSAGAGVGGFALSRAIRFGVSRGIFGNEAGMGSSAIIHASAESKNPREQGAWGVLEVFIDTIVVCSLTAFAILTVKAECADPTLLVSETFGKMFGEIGRAVVSISLAVFSAASMLGWAAYGKTAAEYFQNRRITSAYCVLFVVAVIAGGFIDSEQLWLLSDSLNGLMAMPNLVSLLILRKEVQ